MKDKDKEMRKMEAGEEEEDDYRNKEEEGRRE